MSVFVLYAPIIWHKCATTEFRNSFPWSLTSCWGASCLANISRIMNWDTSWAVFLFTGIASGQRVIASTAAMIYLLPLSVSGSGPMISICTRPNGPVISHLILLILLLGVAYCRYFSHSLEIFSKSDLLYAILKLFSKNSRCVSGPGCPRSSWILRISGQSFSATLMLISSSAIGLDIYSLQIRCLCPEFNVHWILILGFVFSFL